MRGPTKTRSDSLTPGDVGFAITLEVAEAFVGQTGAECVVGRHHCNKRVTDSSVTLRCRIVRLV